MERFIDPKTLARAKDMPLVARTVADGFLHGIQASHQRGVGIEFSQFRSYEPGDEPGRIDWKLFARSDRYFVREAERESEIAIWLVLDCSESMRQQSAAGAWNKFDYARHLLASLAYLIQAQGDLVGMMSLSAAHPMLLPPGTGERQWHRILRQLDEVRSGGEFPVLTQVQSHMARLQQPGLVIVISDFHQASDEIFQWAKRLGTSRNEVAALQLYCTDEADFPWRGPTRFEDLESGETVLVNGRLARDAYLTARDDYQQRLGKALGRLDISLDMLNIDEPLDHGVHAFLARRQRRLRQ